MQSKNDDDDSEAQRNVGWGKITTQSPWARTPRILLFCRISPSASTYAFPRDQPTCGRAKKDTTQPPVKSRVVVARVDSQARFRRPPFPPPPSESITRVVSRPVVEDPRESRSAVPGSSPRPRNLVNATPTNCGSSMSSCCLGQARVTGCTVTRARVVKRN